MIYVAQSTPSDRPVSFSQNSHKYLGLPAIIASLMFMIDFKH